MFSGCKDNIFPVNVPNNPEETCKRLKWFKILFPTNMFQKVLYYSGFIFSCYAFVFILWQNQAYKFQRFKFHAFILIGGTQCVLWLSSPFTWWKDLLRRESPLLPLKRTSSLTSIDIFATANTPLRSEQFHYRGCETSCAMNNFAIAVAIATLRSEQFHYRGCETLCACRISVLFIGKYKNARLTTR